jgi:hypothetical protein
VSLLTIVQSVAQKVLGTPAANIPTAVGSADANVQTILALINEDGQELASRHTWQTLRGEANFSTQGVQGAIQTLTGLVGGAGYAGGFSYLYNNVPLTGGAGTLATATIQVTNGVVTKVTLAPYGTGQNYGLGNVLSAAAANLGGTGAGFQITVATVGLQGNENQGSIISMTGPDFAFVVSETVWDRTTRRPVFGPKTPAEWQQLKAQLMQGPWYQFTVRGNNFLMIPPPAVGDAIYFEWMSKYWCTDTTGATGKTAMNVDSDISKLDETLHILGGIWRFRQGKRLAYQEDQEKYEAKFADLTSRDGVKPTLNLAGAQNDIYPGIVVPSGNWPIAGEPSA